MMKLVVGDEFVQTVSIADITLPFYSLVKVSVHVLAVGKCVGVMVFVFQLVEQREFHFSYEGPRQIVVILPTHEIGEHGDMAVETTSSIPISIHPDTHLVPSRAGVEWTTVPSLFGGLVSAEF